MMTSSNGNIFRVTGPLCGEFTGPGEFPAQRPVTRSFDVFFDLCLNKRLSKQPWGWWFQTPAWSLWRHRNVHWVLFCCGYAWFPGPLFTNVVQFKSHHGKVITHIIKCGMKLLVQTQTSTVQRLKFGNGYLISSDTLLDMWLFIHDGIKVYPCK